MVTELLISGLLWIYMLSLHIEWCESPSESWDVHLSLSLFCQHGLATVSSCEPFNILVSSALFWIPTSLTVNPSSASFLYGGFLLHPQNCSLTAGFLGRWFLPYGVLPLFFQYTMDQTSIFWGFCSYKNGKLLSQKKLYSTFFLSV